MGAKHMQPNEDLIRQTNYFLRFNKIYISEFSRDIGYDRTTVSRYLHGKYDADPTNIEKCIAQYLEARGVTNDSNVMALPQTPPREHTFFESDDAKEVIGLCTACQEEVGMGMIIGKSGYGKSFSLQQYARMPKVAYIACDEIMGTCDLTRAIEKELGLVYKGHGTTWERIQDIMFFLHSHPGYLIIIDEADKLISKSTQKKMELLRSIYDKCNVGIVMAGEPKLRSLVQSYLGRMENRIDFFYELNGLRVKEVDRYLADHQIEPDALQELRKRASTGRRACFRLLDRTLKNIFRILADADSDVITLDVIHAASDMMVL